MTGTPLDLTPFGGILQGIGVLYWLLVVGALGLVLWKAKGWVPKALGCFAVLVVMVLPVALHVFNKQQQHNEAKSKIDAALARFEMRCKGAGEKITRTVENVDGVVWMKWRDKLDVNDDYDQFKQFDPFGRDCTEQGCIEQLLRVTSGADKNPEEAARRKAGYRFVETIDPADQKRYRYVGTIGLRWSAEEIERHKKETGQEPPAFSHTFHTKRSPIESYTARYGIAWDDISTREDREHWVAGGSLKVIDLQTNEVIAERIGYMMDQGQGSRAGFRTPWRMAERTACPVFLDGRRGAESRSFVQKVLQPSKGE
jgi:hypothetical protein